MAVACCMVVEYCYNNIRHSVAYFSFLPVFFFYIQLYMLFRCLFIRNEWNLYYWWCWRWDENNRKAIKRMHANIIRKLSCSLCFISPITFVCSSSLLCVRVPLYPFFSSFIFCSPILLLDNNGLWTRKYCNSNTMKSIDGAMYQLYRDLIFGRTVWEFF